MIPTAMIELMNRTPRSAKRRANRQLLAKEPSPGLQPYRSSASAGSFVRSIRSGTLDCILKPSHTVRCAWRSPDPRERCLQIVECLHGIHHIPLARDIHAAGSPHVHHRIASGPQLDTLKLARQKSRMPHAYGDRLRTAPACELSTTNPGKSSASLPSPYWIHEPMLGRPGMGCRCS